MINPYQFRIGELLTVVYAENKIEAEQKFNDSLKSYNQEITQDFAEQLIFRHFPILCSDYRDIFISQETLRRDAKNYIKIHTN